jgi:germination protein YpeB
MKKRTAVLVVSLLSAAVIVLGIFSLMLRNRGETLERTIQVAHQRAFGDLVSSVAAVDNSLQKSLYATSPRMSGAICTEVFGRAMTAQAALSALPFSTAEIEQVSGFINRVGDYSFTLSRTAAGGKEFSEEERENLRALSDAATVLCLNLTQLQTDMADGALTMDELNDMENRMDDASEQLAPVTVGGGIKLIEQEFPDVPSLVYDGPFSEHLSNPEAAMLKDEQPVDERAARSAAAGFLGIKESAVYSQGSGGGDIPCYYFSAEIDAETLTVGVTERGAKIVSLTSLASPGEPTLSSGEAVGAARQFLERRGYTSMKESYHMIQNGVLTANFAYEQDGVVCYSDLIKVGVRLDTGKICFFESKGYLLNHKPREIAELSTDRDAARQGVPQELTIVSENTALVPTEGRYEIICHEFVCQAEDERKFIIYVNAETGEQEKLLILLEDESGSLTI